MTLKSRHRILPALWLLIGTFAVGVLQGPQHAKAQGAGGQDPAVADIPVGIVPVGAAGPGQLVIPRPDQTGGIQFGTEDVVPDLFTGSATMLWPLSLPPGPGDLRPQVALRYSSSYGNGWLGIGWSFEPAAIKRSSRRGIDYAGDEFVLQTSAGTAELVRISPGEYRLKVEDKFIRIRRADLPGGHISWEVTDRQGQVSTFGSSSASRIHNPSDEKVVAAWFIDSTKDIDGNELSYTYIKMQSYPFLSTIKYAQAIATQAIDIEFVTRSRPDATANYSLGFPMSVDQLLSRIDIKADGHLQNSIELEYQQNADGDSFAPSQVAQIMQTSPTISAPPLTLGYGKQTHVLSSVATQALFADSNGWNADPKYYGTIGFADVNGDGFPDICARDANGIICYLNDGNGTFSQSIRGPALTDAAGWADPKYYTTLALVDVNGDGKADICARDSNGIVCWISSGMDFSTSFRGPSLSDANGWGAPQHYGTIRFVDVTGDGRSDVCARDVNGIACWPSTGTGFGAEIRGPALSDANGWAAAPYYNTIRFVDLNGDGKADICARDGQGLICWISTSNGFGPSFRGPAWSDASGWNSPQYYMTIQFADLNGDGIADVCARDSAGIQCWLGTGTSFVDSFRGPDWSDVSGWAAPQYYYTIKLIDLDGDGKADLCGRDGSGLNCWLGTGSKFTSSTRFFDWSDASGWAGAEHYTTIRFADLTGDGKTSVCGRAAGGLTCRAFTSSEAFLLTRFSNGIGGTTDIRYNRAARTKNNAIPFSVPILSEVAIQDGLGNTSTTNYAFEDGVYYSGERDLRGFGFVKVVEPGGAERKVTSTWFHQGNEADPKNDDPLAPGGLMKGKVYRQEIGTTRGHLLSRTEITYQQGTGPSFFSPPKTIEKWDCDGPSNCPARSAAHFEYDSFGNVVKQEEETGIAAQDRTVIREYATNIDKWILGALTHETVVAGIGAGGQKLSETHLYFDGTDSCGIASSSTFPDKGHVTRIVVTLDAATQAETLFGYDRLGNVVCTRDPRGSTGRFDYDASGTFLLKSTNALGHVAAVTYAGVNGIGFDDGPFGVATAFIAPNGAKTSIKYDGVYRQKTVTHADGRFQTVDFKNFGDPRAQYILTTEPNGIETATYFDGRGRIREVHGLQTPGVTVVKEIAYAPVGKISQGGRWRLLGGASTGVDKYSYDAYGRLSRIEGADGAVWQYCYAPRSRDEINPHGLRTRVKYRHDGKPLGMSWYSERQLSCDGPFGAEIHVASYSYDPLGNLLGQVDAVGSSLLLTYDLGGRLIKVSDPDAGTSTRTFDTNGNLIKVVDAENRRTYFRYDVLNRRVQIDYHKQKPAGKGDVIFRYDVGANGVGRLTSMHDQTGGVRYGYDRVGRERTFERKIGLRDYRFSSEYDLNGRLTELTYPDQTKLTYQYAGAVLSSVTLGKKAIAAFDHFTEGGKPTVIRFGNGVETQLKYSRPNNEVCSFAGERLCSIITLNRNSGGIVQSTSFEYDRGQNLAREANDLEGIKSFRYDLTGMLVFASRARDRSVQTFDYDDAGRITYNSAKGPFRYSNLQGPKNAPRAIGSVDRKYDRTGNLISTGRERFSYDRSGRLAAIRNGAGHTKFQYDGFGFRTSALSRRGEYKFVHRMYECNHSGCVKLIFAGPRLLAQQTGSDGELLYYHPNFNGSISSVTGHSGRSVARFEYSAFGELVAAHVERKPESLRKFTAGFRDADSGLYLFGSRYYDPASTLFLSPDPIGATADPVLNRYSYAGGNPFKFVDPSGAEREYSLFTPSERAEHDRFFKEMNDRGDRMQREFGGRERLDRSRDLPMLEKPKSILFGDRPAAPEYNLGVGRSDRNEADGWKGDAVYPSWSPLDFIPWGSVANLGRAGLTALGKIAGETAASDISKGEIMNLIQEAGFEVGGKGTQVLPGGTQTAETLFEKLSRGARNAGNAYREGGKMVETSEGVKIGIGPSARGGETRIDINRLPELGTSWGKGDKVKLRFPD